jgi:Cellulose biosynthesis protein BcsS
VRNVLRFVLFSFFRSLAQMLATIACTLAPASFAAAGGPQAGAPSPRFEAWTGAEVFQQVWSIYAGGTYAPYGSVRQDGFRMRAVAGYGAYSYASRRWTGLATQQVQFHGSVAFADLLAGYHQQLGSLTIKVLGGLTVADRTVDDPDAPNQGTRAGGKAVIETWWNVTDQAWASVDLSWSALENVYGTRARVGWRWWPQLSVGVEGGAAGSFDYDTARFGGFVRYEWGSGELSVSGGVSGDGPSSGWVDVHGPFATVNVMTRF